MGNSNQTRLIIFEGLPSTGKSTNSRILLSQLERNGYKARWYHEDSRPHPTSFFYEASLSEAKYDQFLFDFPNTERTLEHLKITRKHSISFDLLDIKWKYLDVIGTEAYNALTVYDVWNYPLEKYIDLALDKWEHFVSQVNPEEVILLDSSFFQFQIYTFLLEKAAYSALETFIKGLSQIISRLNPTLIYIYRNNVEDTISYLEKNRGVDFLEQIWNRDKHLPYYQGKPTGAEGYREFLRDYSLAADRLFQMVPFDKMSLEISEGHWRDNEAKILKHFHLEYKKEPTAQLVYDRFKNKESDLQIVMDGLFFIDPRGKRKRIFPKSKNEFYIEDLPVILYFPTPEKLIMHGQQLNDRWTTTGTEYLRVDE
jgi:hypothetical protein